jgi:hypothetical protein
MGFSGMTTDPDKRLFEVKIEAPAGVIFDGTVSFSNTYQVIVALKTESTMTIDAQVIRAGSKPCGLISRQSACVEVPNTMLVATLPAVRKRWRISRRRGSAEALVPLAAHFIKKTRILALTIMDTKSGMQRFPFHVGLNPT